MPLRERISSEEVNMLPPLMYNGEIVLIDTIEDIDSSVAEIEQYAFIGFDTESKPTFKKGDFNPISLLQFATPKKVYLFRINKIGMPTKIKHLLSNKNKIKLGIALHNDINDLRKLGVSDFEGFQDIHSYIKEKGVINTGLRKLAAMILGGKISKSHQVSNWENEVLSEGQQRYAATDAWVCLKLYDKLKELKIIK